MSVRRRVDGLAAPRACRRCEGSGLEPPAVVDEMAKVRTRENLEAFYGQLARMYDRYVDNGNTWQPRTGGLSLAEKMVELAAAAIEQHARDRTTG